MNCEVLDGHENLAVGLVHTVLQGVSEAFGVKASLMKRNLTGVLFGMGEINLVAAF
jgi:hypothetical protein